MLIVAIPRPLPDPCAPPCIRHLLFPATAGDRQGVPARVLAPHRVALRNTSGSATQGPDVIASLPVITLGEEEISDVNLATFYVLDKEDVEFGERVQLARRGCGGCGCTGLQDIELA